MGSVPPDDTIWLGEYVAVLRRRKWLIFLVTLLGVLAAAGYTKEQTPSYQSTAKVLATGATSSSGGANAGPDMQTEQAFVTSDDVTKCASLLMNDATFKKDPTSATFDASTTCAAANIATEKLDRRLQANLVVTVLPQSRVMTIAFSDPSKARAQTGAQAFATSYVFTRTTEAQDSLNRLRAPLEERQKSLSGQLSKVNNQIAKAIAASSGAPPNQSSQQQFINLNSQRSDIEQQLGNVSSQLLTLDPSKLTPPSIILPGQLPFNPSSPDFKLNLIIGLALGLALAMVVAFIRDRLDDGLRGRSDLEASLGAPVLAVIPRVAGWKNKSEARLVVRDQPKGAVTEAYRTLRASISFLGAQRDLKVIMVTSPSAGEGKTTTAANLALVLADAGRRVVLASADLRKPRIQQFFNCENDEFGISSVLSGEVAIWDAIKDPGVNNLRLLLSGPVPHGPAEMLQSEAMGEILTALREITDFVILDTAPLLLVADGLSLAPLVDGVLFVADAEATSRGAVAHARDQLEQIGANVIGAVLNDFDPAKAKAYSYYGYGAYRYGYGYGYGTYGYGPAENGEAKKERRGAVGLTREAGNPEARG